MARQKVGELLVPVDAQEHFRKVSDFRQGSLAPKRLDSVRRLKRRNPMSRITTISLAALLLLSGSAYAGLNDVRTNVIVPLKDLNLSSPADARIAFQRIEHAASKACGGNPLARTWLGQPTGSLFRQYTLCREEAVARTVAKLPTPRIKTAYLEKHGHTTEHWADEYRR
jgi:UrcA family protein